MVLSTKNEIEIELLTGLKKMSRAAAFSFLLLMSTLHGTTNAEHISTLNSNVGRVSTNFERSPFRIVIDGGSTGSRLHVFEFVRDGPDQEVRCVRRGSVKAYTPLSAFARTPNNNNVEGEKKQPLNPAEVAEHMVPLFEYAANVIPPMYHATTLATYQATAGMRLLEKEEQDAIYDALYEGLVESEVFRFDNMRREDIDTLGGDNEGFYGAVAANYLKGLVDAHLRVVSPQHHQQQQQQQQQQQSNREGSGESVGESSEPIGSEDIHHGPLGALDMGGASAQIMYLPPDAVANIRGTSCASTGCRNNKNQPYRLKRSDFFSTSYLAYGVDQFRERMWDTWIEDHYKDYENGDYSQENVIISNPCAFRGHELRWKDHTFIGTGDAHKCTLQVRRLLPHDETVYDASSVTDFDYLKRRRVVGGVEHPPVRGKFIGMCLFFFTLDSLRELSRANPEAHEAINLSWPNPSIEELTNALDGLCSRSWQEDLELIQHNSHKFTRAEVLPHRCIESVYLVTLLRDGFGFHPKSRDITFTFHVNDSEVEWSLGLALASFAEEDGAAVTDLSRSVPLDEEF